MKDYMDLPATLALNITGGATSPQTSFIGKYPIGVGSVISTDVDGDGPFLHRVFRRSSTPC